MKIEKVGVSLVLSGTLSTCLLQIFRFVSEGNKPNPHPNVLPVIELSETLFPFCIVTPWMPDGNIIQYTQVNPSANRLVLVRVHRPEDLRG